MATFAERKSRLYLAFLMADRTAASMEITIGRLLKLLGSELVQRITTDCGKEFT
ncbi:MAG: hypothetical protein GX046_07750 [Tissierellia bacterium]|nr:hypothetical protein [Tissierellia bacterium]